MKKQKQKMTPIEDLGELIKEISPAPLAPPTLERNLYGKFFDSASTFTTPAKGTYWTTSATGGTSYVYDAEKMIWTERPVS